MAQAQRLGAEVLVPVEVMGVTIREGYKHLSLSDGRQIVTRTLAAATGMEYRQHPAAGIPEHTGAGVYCGAPTPEGGGSTRRRRRRRRWSRWRRHWR